MGYEDETTALYPNDPSLNYVTKFFFKNEKKAKHELWNVQSTSAPTTNPSISALQQFMYFPKILK